MSINAKLGDILRAVTRTGADFADMYFEIAASHSYAFEDGSFEEISSSSSEGVGARILLGEATSLAYAPGVALETGASCLHEAAEHSGLSLPCRRMPAIRVMEREPPFPTPEYAFFYDLDKRIKASSMWIRQVSMNLDTAFKSFSV